MVGIRSLRRNEEKAQPAARANSGLRPEWLILNVRQKMKTVCLLLFALFAGVGGNTFAADSPARVSKEEVWRLTLAVALLDYPIEQSKIREALGIPETVKPTLGGVTDDWRDTYWLWFLTEFDDGSYYALK